MTLRRLATYNDAVADVSNQTANEGDSRNFIACRCRDYRSEIERLSSAYEVLVQRLSMKHDHDEPTKVAEIQKKSKEEMERLKSRMKGRDRFI